MNREIKFRVWCNSSKQWGKAMGISFDDSCIVDLSECFWNCGIGECHTIQQFTGLLDKTGREIYEGDIILSDKLNYEVYWDEYKWNAKCPNYRKYHWPQFNEQFRAMCNSGVIVGNIFENPDLIKQTSE